MPPYLCLLYCALWLLGLTGLQAMFVVKSELDLCFCDLAAISLHHLTVVNDGDASLFDVLIKYPGRAGETVSHAYRLFFPTI